MFLVFILLAQTGVGLADGPVWNIRTTGSRRIELEATLPGIQLSNVQEPAFARLVPAPDGLVPKVEIVELDTIVVLTDKAGAAVSNRPWVSFGRPAIAAGLEVVPLVLTRVRETEEDGKSAVCRRIKVSLTYDHRVKGLSGKGVMGRLVASVLEGEGPDYRLDQPGYLVIVPDEFYDNILPFAAWKERKGFKVWTRKLSETGTQREQIRDYIQDAYNNWTPSPSYVVLVGAISKVPAFITSRTPCVTDHPYACVDGDDFLADLFVGRLPGANASELDVIVAKTIGYETAPYIEDTTWFHRALMVGTSYQEGGTPAITAIITKRLIRERLLEHGFTRIDTIFYPPTRHGRGPVDSAVNRGVSFVNGRGWGNRDGWGYPQFLTNDVYGLANGWKLPVVTSIYCGTGNFAANPCFGEAWLRAGTPANPKGGVAFWGSSWSGTSTRWNNCMDYAIYRAIFDWSVHTCGPAMYLSKIALYENFPLAQDSFDLRIYFHVYNLLGDPGLEMWTRAPQQLNVSYPGFFPVGTSSFEVTVEDGSDRPVEEALVCLCKPGEVHATERTDASGKARFAIATGSADTMLVTVTGDNLVPHLGYSAGLDAGVFVGHENHSPDTVEPNSNVNLSVTLKNFGNRVAATNVQALLRSLDTFALVTDSVRDYGDLAPGASFTAPAFVIQIARSCTSGQILPFELAITSQDSTWLSAFQLEVTGPCLKVASYTVHNASGFLDPGETAEMSITVQNSGAGGAGSVTGRLISLNPCAIVVLDSSGSFGTIAPGDSGVNTTDRFQVRAGDGIGIGRKFSLRIVMTGDGGFEQTWDFPVTVGQPVSSSPLGPDRRGYYAYDNTDAGYTERPDFDWVEIDPGHGGSGMHIELGNDQAAPIALPFTFRFYGQDYDTVSICDNGYVAMGNTWFGEIYNWHIPSANGPDGFVAVFWDDFRTDTLNAPGVFTLYDQANHRFIIEWSRCYHVHGFRPPRLAEQQTFEVILYDPQHHHTETGDGAIECQYLVVQNDDSLHGNCHNFATVGIQSPGHDDGLEYTFAGSYPAAAAEVVPNRAIRFTTNPPDTFTGVRENQGRPELGEKFRVAPNPARNRLVIELSGIKGRARLQVFDVRGREVRSFDLAGAQEQRTVWDLCDASGRRVGSGVYVLRLTPIADGGSILVTRVLTLAGDCDRY